MPRGLPVCTSWYRLKTTDIEEAEEEEEAEEQGDQISMRGSMRGGGGLGGKGGGHWVQERVGG